MYMHAHVVCVMQFIDFSCKGGQCGEITREKGEREGDTYTLFTQMYMYIHIHVVHSHTCSSLTYM